ncbi:MAG: hypothetical protein JWM76_1725 [Pseudonocardiales bacterium]|nr:hypothetical protein [Pseudonocardiales bacterium]
MSRRASRLGLTTRGSALLTAGITAAVCGVALGQRDLVRVAFLLMAAPLIASIVVSRSRLSIACERRATPERVAPGEPVTVQITLVNQSLLPTGSLMLEDNLPASLGQRARFTLDSLRGREQRSLAYRLPLASRGHYSVGPLRMRLADPFGLVERTRSFRSVDTVVVLPAVEPLSQSALPGAWDSSHQASSHSVGSLGADDASIREYRYGDDLRKVHWRSTARRGSIMVRQEERPWHARTVLLLDTRTEAHRRVGPNVESVSTGPQGDARDTDSFEWAVSAAASICVLLRSKGREVDIVAGTIPSPVGNPETLLDRLADLTPSGEIDLRSALDTADSIGRDSTLFAVLGRLDEASIRLLSKERRSPGSAIALLLDTASWGAPAEANSRPNRDAYELARVRLTGAGWRVAAIRRGDSIEKVWAQLINTPILGSGRSSSAEVPSFPTARRP